jgi:signal transduction histidine kinase
MKRPAGSLTVRLALITSLWVTVGLLVTWFHVSELVVNQIEESFSARAIGLLDAVVAAAGVDASGQPQLLRPISESRFDQPLSGIYWQIEAAPDRLVTSRSLWDQRLPLDRVGHSGVFTRNIAGPRGQHLRLVERDVVLPDATTPLHVEVAVARDATDAEISRLQRGLAVSFVLLGVGLVAVVVATVSFGLRPLRRLRLAVAALRAGRHADLHLLAPAEVQPLVTEIDALVTQNRATVERARNHVGNLAHALRTRLAVLRNALEDNAGTNLTLALQELATADHIVQHHLARARGAALSGTAATNANVLGVAEEIAQALRRLFMEHGLRVDVSANPSLTVICERQDLSEMLGNLMENACKWAHSQVRMTALPANGNIAIVVEDDGPGLPDEQFANVQARGTRLDEATPGTGLGLSIVADLAALYSGHLDLQRSMLGGFAARLTLPTGPCGEPYRAVSDQPNKPAST